LEANRLEGRHHVGGIILRVRELSGVLVSGIADHQRHAAAGMGNGRN